MSKDFPYEAKAFVTPEFTINYPSILERKLMPKKDPTDKDVWAFSCQAVIDSTKDQWEALAEEIKGWGRSVLPPSILAQFGMSDIRSYFTVASCDDVNVHSGNIPSENNPALAGKYYVNLKNKRHKQLATLSASGKPLMASPDYADLMEEEKGNFEEIYSGCVCKAVIEATTYKASDVGVTSRLMVVKKLRDGEPLDPEAKASDKYVNML